jgi:hypothetical protein
MGGEEEPDSNRMAKLVRTSISMDERQQANDVFSAMDEKDVRHIAEKAMPNLTASEVRRFIARCFNGKRERLGLIMAEQAVAYYRLRASDGDKNAEEIMGNTVAILSMLGESNPNAKEKLFEFLGYNEPGILISVLQNIPRNSDIEKFRKVCEYFLHPDFEVRKRAVVYVEECTRDAAFRKMKRAYRVGDGKEDFLEGTYRIGKEEEDFLRKTLVPLEAAYTKLKEGGGEDNTRKRLAILVALIYNEILDATDWKRMYGQPVEEGIYYALEDHLQNDIAPEALPLMSKMLKNTKLEEGVEKCVLGTIGRMGNSEKHRGKVIPLLMDYSGMNRPDSLRDVARMALDAHRGGKRFSSIPAPIAARSSAIIRRSLMPSKPG